MKNTITVLVIILGLLLTNCKNSSRDVEPAKEYNVKIKNSSTLINKLDIISYDVSGVVLAQKSYVDLLPNQEISYDFDKCFKISMNIIATGSKFVTYVTITKNNIFVEQFPHWGQVSSKYEYWLK